MIKIFYVILIDSKIISKLPIKIFSPVLWVQIMLWQCQCNNSKKFSSCGVPNNTLHKYQVLTRLTTTTQQPDEPNIKFAKFLL